MFQRLILYTPFPIVRMITEKKRVLTTQEQQAETAFMRHLKIRRRSTMKPVVIAMAGLVGSGKTSVACRLAEKLGGTVIGADQIRVQLRKQKTGYGNTWKITESAALAVLEKSGLPILDSDYSDPKKQRTLEERMHRAGVRVITIYTHAHPHITIGRAFQYVLDLVDKRHRVNPDNFFEGASTPWKGDPRLTAGIVKIGEWQRRTPHHWQWTNTKTGGIWRMKKPACRVFATVDTTETQAWQQAVDRIAREIAAKFQ